MVFRLSGHNFRYEYTCHASDDTCVTPTAAQKLCCPPSPADDCGRLERRTFKTPCNTKQLFPHNAFPSQTSSVHPGQRSSPVGRASDVPPPVIATRPVPATHFAPCHCPQATRIHKAYPPASSGLDVSARSLRNETVLASLVGEEPHRRRRLGRIGLSG